MLKNEMRDPICISLRGVPLTRRHGAFAWAIEHFGNPSDWGEEKGWRASGKVYIFYNEEDAMLFLLRWPGRVIDTADVVQGMAS